MKIEEKQLFINLCKYNSNEFDEKLLQFATPDVLGRIFYNRMQGVAYGVLSKNSLLNNINREFRNSLFGGYEINKRKNESFLKCVSWLSKVLYPAYGKFAMLKGALLCAKYPIGYRTSNDIDLLVLPQDITAIGDLLRSNGFVQGYIKNDEFIAATRKEIIESRMMRGETVPYIKQVDLPLMKFLEVDINFSLDYKSSDNNLVLDMLSHATEKSEKDILIPTLSNEDFFIHLCTHLYKEATTFPWIKMNRDMTLYKYCDIYMLLSEMNDAESSAVFARAKELELELPCAYAVHSTMELFEMNSDIAKAFCNGIIENNPSLLLTVINPQEKTVLTYEYSNITERFFNDNRLLDLTGEQK